MSYKEIKDLINKLDSTNVEELKPELNRKVNEIITNIYDDIPDDELEKACNTTIARELFREGAKEENVLMEGVFTESFIKSLDEFLNKIKDEVCISDKIEIINDCLRSIGGHARAWRIAMKYSPSKGYETIQHLEETKDEFYKQLRLYSTKGIMGELFVVSGLIKIVRFSLEEKLQEHGRVVIALLTDRKTKKLSSVNEFENKPHTDAVKLKLTKEYGEGLQKSIYLWDELTLKLQDHYYLEKLCDEAMDDIE